MGALAAGCAAGDDNPVKVDGGGDAAADSGEVDAGRRDTGPGPDAGPDAGDGGMLPMVGLCEECVVHAQCGASARCAELTSGTKVCLAICDPDIPSCPRGFECVTRFTGPELPTCAPIGELCCIDSDADGYGQGGSCMGPDCDDENIDVHPDADEVCNDADDDCDDTVDEEVTDCGGQRCVRLESGSYQELPPDACEAGMCTEAGGMSCGLYTCADGEDAGDVCATTCVDADGADTDALCIPDAHCDDGSCVEDVGNGEACDEDSDCGSGYCDNGFCCDGGTCCNVASDCPSTGGLGTTCDDAATCQGSRGEIVCESFQCATNDGIDDDSACDDTVKANDCGFFDPIYCTGAENQSPPSCPSTCSSDEECDEGAHCDTVCVPDVSDGDVCNEDSDCISGYCDNNVCCSGGDCCRTPDDCPSSYSTAPTCDDPSSCQGTRDAATCADFVCGTNENVPDDSACTASIEADTCGLYPSRYCSGGTDQTNPTCASSCSSDGECDEGAHCDLGSCVPDLPDGEACDEASDCQSGHCQNGFCCASGDCCSTGSDCPFATYGEPSTCNSASTCQGQRRDPVCNSTSQCQTGPLVDDDSGCDGLLSNACGLYPSVYCTSETSQPSDQASLCDMSCTADGDCDSGAFCNSSNECEAQGEVGDPCTSGSMCDSSLSCVDGVCCTSSCTGTCQACNVAGSEGTCTDIPDGSDPANECDGFSCSDYYWGWSGDMCYRRANASAADVACDGTGSCQTAADVCPSQGQGSLQIDCDDLCQDPTSGTCTGTSQGACNNVTPSPSTQTCGTGACEVTTNRCNSGTQVTCEPDSPSSETCNDVDDDCDGSTDEGLSGDIYESNDSCSAAHYIGKVYSSSKAGEPTTRTITPTLYGDGDVDVFRVAFEENDSACSCCDLLCLDEDHAVNVTLTVPANAGSYEICNRQSGTCGASNCKTVAAGASGSVRVWKDGACGPGQTDTGTWWFFVRPVGSPGFECAPYTLEVTGERGCS